MYIEMVVKRNVYITLLASPFQQVALAFMWGSLLLHVIAAIGLV